LPKGNNIENESNTNKFSVFKVNGTTNISHKVDGLYEIIPDYNISKDLLVESFLEIFSSQKLWDDHEPKMSFAWENSQQNSIFKVHLMNSIRNTDVLVVIGYSFPFFNRKMDGFILNSMKELKKVFVQDPNHAEDIIEKIKGLKPYQRSNVSIRENKYITNTKDTIHFFPITFTNQFYIPVEF